MLDWLARRAGVEAAEGTRLEFAFASLPSSWWALLTVLAAAAMLVAVVAFYRREGAGSLWRKRFLAAVRCTILLLLFLVLFEPVVVPSLERVLDAYTVVLVDDSLSMSIRDRYEDPAERASAAAAAGLPPAALASGEGVARSQIVEGILNRDDCAFLRALEARNRVRLFAFSDGARDLPLPFEGSGIAGEETATPVEPVSVAAAGAATDLAAGVRAALARVGRPVAGLILLSDGRFNRGEGPGSAGEALRRAGIRAWSVAVGSARPPKNVRVLDLAASEAVYIHDPVLIRARLESTGFDGRKAVLKLTEQGEDATPPRMVASQDLELTGGPQELELRVTPDRTGRFLYTLVVETFEDEITTEDNQRSAPVKVLEDKVKVLLVAGGPSYEYRFVKNLLLREKSMNLSCWLQGADPTWPQEGAEPLRELPRREKELFAFDVVLLFDVDPKEVDGAWAELLRRFVGDHGGGLLFLAGEKHAHRFFLTRDLAPLADILPAVPDLRELDRRSLSGEFYPDPWRMNLTDEGAGHAMTRLAEDPHVNRELWRALPGFTFHFPLDRLKPGASALLRHSAPHARNRSGAHALLAVHFYGPGRVALLATDETWRWRERAEDLFDAFWVRAVRTLSEGRLLGERKRTMLLLEKNAYAVGEKIALRLRLLGPSFEPVEIPAAELKIRGGKGWERVVSLAPPGGSPGWYEGSFIAPEGGSFEILPHALGPVPTKRGESLARIQVELPALEFAQARTDRGALAAFAEKTGGRLVPLEEIETLPGKIPALVEKTVISERPVKLWDNWLVLVLILGLLTLEWAVRKLARMA